MTNITRLVSLSVVILVLLVGPGCSDVGLEYVPPRNVEPDTSKAGPDDYDLLLDFFPIHVGNYWTFDSDISTKPPGGYPVSQRRVETFTLRVIHALEIKDQSGCVVSRLVHLEEAQEGLRYTWRVGYTDGEFWRVPLDTLEVNETGFLVLQEDSSGIKHYYSEWRLDTILDPVFNSSILFNPLPRFAESIGSRHTVQFGAGGLSSTTFEAGIGPVSFSLHPHALGTTTDGSRVLTDYKVDSNPLPLLAGCPGR